MQVSFIIPLYNCLAPSRECLRTLRATLPSGLTYEIILVDDGSPDGTREWLATLPAPCRVLLNEQNLGFARTCNRGAAAARGEVLFFLNDDLVFLAGWFGPMHRLARRSDAGLVGNVQRHAGSGALDHTGIRFNNLAKPEHARRRWPSSFIPRWLIPWPLSVRSVPALTGACCAIRRDVWQRLGGFDDSYVNGAEDLDLCFRAAAAGLQNRVALRSVILHHVSQSPGRKLRDEENSFRLAIRWRGQLERLSARACCPTYLEVHWEEPRNFPSASQAALVFLYRYHLWPTAPAAALRAAADALDRELRRWNTLFPNRAVPVPPETAPPETTPRVHRPAF